MNAPFSFEQAYARLDEILEKINSGKVTLDDSLKLYEEADTLMKACHSRLNDAERRIEILIKNRNGELTTNEEGKPILKAFSAQTPSAE